LRRPPSNEPELFDAILCLSVTKWVHFTRGDSGIRKLFRRVLKRLRPGGVFVLEPQEWSSYKKKRHLTPEIRQTVAGIEMKPSAFDDYLVGLGFEKVATIAPPSEGPQGFRRSILVYRKPRAEGPPEEEEGEEEAADGKISKKRKKQKKAEIEEEPAEEEEEEEEAEERARRKAAKRRHRAAEAAAGEEAEAGEAAAEEEEEGRTRKKAKKQHRADDKDADTEAHNDQEKPLKNGHSKASKRCKAADEDDEGVLRKAKEEKNGQPSKSSEEVISTNVAEVEQESNEPIVLLRRGPKWKIDWWS